jgi:hypothetical protein
MPRWTDAIYDRTTQDIIDKTSKGYFNIVDYTRIHNNHHAVHHIIEVMRFLLFDEFGHIVPLITTIPTMDDINTLVQNIQQLRGASGLPLSANIKDLKTNWGGGMGESAPDFEIVNDWERNLAFIRSLIVESSKYLVWCGVGAAGQPRFWQQRFRTWPYFIQPQTNPTRRPRTEIAICGSGLTRQNYWRNYA